MPTIYQRITVYQNDTSVEISRKKINKISNVLRYIYDKNKNKQPIHYVQSIEPDGTYEVRHYPSCFTRMIDKVIKSIAEKVPELQPPILQEIVPKNVPKKRKRISVSRSKPVYSTKKSTTYGENTND